MVLIGAMHQHLNRLQIDIPRIKVLALDVQALLGLALEMIYGFSLGQFRDEGAF